MINDNALALSRNSSTKEMAIQESSIRRQIAFHEALIKEKEQTISEAEKAISAAYSDIHLAEEMLAGLRNRLSGDNNTSIKQDLFSSGAKLSKKQMVRNVIDETTIQKGIMVPEMKDSIREKYKVSMSSTTIDEKVSELVQEGHVFQVNEGRVRGKRYLPKK